MKPPADPPQDLKDQSRKLKRSAQLSAEYAAILKKFYRGFDIEDPVGNNAFSYGERKNKKIFIPPLVEGDIKDITVGEKTAFSEIVDSVELNHQGLKQFIYCSRNGKHILFFDNHNHAFFFWVAGVAAAVFPTGKTLVHVDQHTDWRKPAAFFETDLKAIDLNAAFHYTNRVLNVGDFLKAADQLKLFSHIEMVTGSRALQKNFNDEIVLDLDMDFFSSDMTYISDEAKKQFIKGLIRRSRFITIATSPFFMEQDRAITIIRELFED